MARNKAGDARDYEYVLFIDEAGDVGTRTAAEGDKGSSAWFCLGGVVLRRKYEPEIPGWIQSIKLATSPADDPELHYKLLSSDDRVAACRCLAEQKLKVFVVASHKENYRGHRNPRAARMSGQMEFYNFCLRILLERVSELVAASSMNAFGEKRKLRIVIAQTGAVRYSQTKAYFEYLRHQARTNTTYLKAKIIDHEVIDWQLIEEVSAKTTAGVQLADVAVSAFYNALNDKGRNAMFIDPAKALEPAMGRQFGRVSNFGLKLLPWDQNIPHQYRAIFEHYGYGWAPE